MNTRKQAHLIRETHMTFAIIVSARPAEARVVARSRDSRLPRLIPCCGQTSCPRPSANKQALRAMFLRQAHSPTRYATIASKAISVIIHSIILMKTLTSKECTLVLKLLKRTCSTFPRSIRWGSASPHVDGIATSGESFVYASRVNVPNILQMSRDELYKRAIED